MPYPSWRTKNSAIKIYYPHSNKLHHLAVSTFCILKKGLSWHDFSKTFKNFLLSFNYSCMPFLPIPPPHPSQTHLLPHLHPPTWFCPCVLYSSSCKPLSPLSPPQLLLAIVRLFLTSMSPVIFCLLFSFVDYVPVKGEIIWYLSLTAWLISLSIMLSSSIHALAKDISSFFLSAA